MSTIQKYYPPVSDLIDASLLPGDLQAIENHLQQGVDFLLGHIYYKDFVVQVNNAGDAKNFSLVILTRSLKLPLLANINMVFFQGEDSNLAEFPIVFQWEWPLYKYFPRFKNQGFSYAPEAFLDILIELSEINDRQDFFSQIVSVFLNDGNDAYLEFFDNISAQVITYDNGVTAVKDELESIIDNIAVIKSELETQLTATNLYTLLDLFENYESNGVLNDAVGTIIESLEILDGVYNVQINLYKDILASLLKGFSNLDEKFARLFRLFRSWLRDIGMDDIKSFLLPQFSFQLNNINIGLEFPRKWLVPVYTGVEPVTGLKIDDPLPEPFISTLLFNAGSLTYSTRNGFKFDNQSSFTFKRSMIGKTGLIIEFTNVKLDFSKTSNIPEADAAGYPVDFTGVYAEEAILGFRNFGTPSAAGSAKITAENLFIGTGGVTGKFALESNGLLRRDFGGFKAEIKLFELELKMGSIVSSAIKGQLTLNNKIKQNGQAAVIDISAQIKDNGNFKITAASQDIEPFDFLSVFLIKVKTLEIGKEDRGYYAETSGSLDFTFDFPLLGDILPKGIEVNRLRIWDDGKIEFEPGIGKLNISRSFTLNIGPVKMEVKNIDVGSHNGQHNGEERNYMFFVFDGMVNTGRAGINTSGNGIKFYFTVDDGPFHAFLSVDRINIDMSIPGNVPKDKAAFLLNGYLSMANPNENATDSKAAVEYTGAVSFGLPRLKLAGTAGMRLNPNTPAFVVDIGLELSTPIILGATGLGIYGFRGIIGQHYLPSKTATTPPLSENATWWEYYKAKSTITNREGIELDKFADKSGFSVGAGASIATAFDSGKVFSSKLFLLLGLPDVFLMQGQAGILRSRVGLKDTADPPFSAFISIDSNSFMAGLGVNYNLPDISGNLNGAIFSVSGNMELAFFFNNASGWYLNLGQDQPESKRIRAKILTLFQGYAYLMISSRGFKVGAGAKFDVKRSFGPAAVAFGAWVDMGGSISFKPVQVGAFLRVGGYVYIKVWKFKFNLTVGLGLAVDAPHPFAIQGSIFISLRVIFFKIKFSLELTWRINGDKGPLLQPQPILELPNPNKGYLPAAATNIMSGDVFTVNYINQVFTGSSIEIPLLNDARWEYDMSVPAEVKQVTIPIDSFIDIDLQKSVKPTLAKLGGGTNQLAEGYSELIPPQKGITGQVRHEYEVVGLDIYCWDAQAGAWKPYQIYEAVTAIVKDNIDPITQLPIVNLSTLKIGYWQFSQANRYNKIRLLSQHMFSFANQSTDTLGDLDGLNFKRKDLFCFETVSKQQHIHWKDVAQHTTYPDLSTFYKGGFTFQLRNVAGEVVSDTTFGGNSLELVTYGGKLIIYPSQPITSLKLNFGANENRIRIDFIKRIYRTEQKDTEGSSTVVSVPEDFYMPPAFVEADESQLSIGYNNLDNPISRVEISFIADSNLSFEGDLNLGGFYKLPDPYAVSPIFPLGHEQEKDKALVYITLFNTAFSEQQVLAKGYQDTAGAVANWLLNSSIATVSNLVAIPIGSPDLMPGFFKENGLGQQTLGQVYQYHGLDDSLLVPYQLPLKVETGNFALETMVAFSPFTQGIATVFSKVQEDAFTGDKQGYALHLLQEDAVQSYTNYMGAADLPKCAFYLTFYSGQTQVGFKIEEPLSLDCATGYVTDTQYKQVFISVNRDENVLEVFVDRVKKLSVEVPAELKIIEPVFKKTSLQQLSYLTEELQRRLEDNELTEEKLIQEIQLMGDGLSKTIQPVWRPNTNYALAIKTRDVVDGKPQNATVYTQVFGFKTAGPIGHFHQQSVAYNALALQDRAEEFRLLNLKNYIDYERSFPDAQSRYDLSKPVFYHNPKIRLLFTKPYVQAMFEDFDTYQGLKQVKSSLDIMVVDVFGTTTEPSLVWEQLPDKEITINNYMSLPADQRLIFLMNWAASQDNCNAQPLVMKKRSKQGAYQLADLLPNKVYTAIFNANYQPEGEDLSSVEVHRFNFISSRYANFQEQASSFVLNRTVGEESFAIAPLYTAFTVAEIENDIIPLLDDPTTASDEVMRYAVKYDRLVYGGLKLKNLLTVEDSLLQPLINIDPDTQERRLLGLLIRNPEPFNDPKLPVDLLADTVFMEVPGNEDITFRYIHARNTSAVLISNDTMNLQGGLVQLTFKYKIFNGENYTTTYELYTSPAFNLDINI